MQKLKLVKSQNLISEVFLINQPYLVLCTVHLWYMHIIKHYFPIHSLLSVFRVMVLHIQKLLTCQESIILLRPLRYYN